MTESGNGFLRPADNRGMTRIVHQAGAAIQFVMWVALWIVLTLAIA